MPVVVPAAGSNSRWIAIVPVAPQGGVDLFVKEVAGESRAATPLHADSLGLGRFALDWSRDFFLYVGGGRGISRSDVWIAPAMHPSKARALLDSASVETHGQVAPQGGWFAYMSNETGRPEVYVDRFPALGDKRLVSTEGGAWPRWARHGAELYYVSQDNQLMAAPVVVRTNGLDIGPPRRLFTIRPRPHARLDAYAYDVAPDGRFIVNTLREDPDSASITLSQHWTAALAN